MTSSEHYVPLLKFAVEFKGCAYITWPWQDPHQDTNTRSPTNPLHLTRTLSCIFPCRLQLCPPVLHCDSLAEIVFLPKHPGIDLGQFHSL